MPLSPFALARSSVAFLCALALAGCSSDPAADGSEGGAGSPGVIVQVPKVEGPVALDQFCSTYAQIHCAANTTCCTRGEHYASVDECLKASPCPDLIAAAGKSGRVSGGQVVYDAGKAGDALRQMAASASTCGASSGLALASVFRGTLAEGADCSPTGEADTLSDLACGEGLGCQQSQDDKGAVHGVCAKVAPPPAGQQAGPGAACEDDGDCASGRCAAGSCAPQLEAGEACQSGSDCESGQCHDQKGKACQGGSCSCAAAGELYCSGAAEETPANTDWSSPDYLCATANSSSGGGTTNDVTLGWLYDNKRYKCTVTGGIAAGSEGCCVPALSTSYTGAAGTAFGVNNDSGDGLRITRVKAKKGSDTWSASSFYNGANEVKCVGCSILGTGCESCWLDNDGNGNCHTFTTYMTGSHSVSCNWDW